ncbi:mobile mystery protein A [Granulicella sp. dw_53]|uniref:mobile mystery protein A n=1 Tax=Granulicella sp. dw_53 TaxID=2719792 RepID=UPI001BD37B7B|nr:mobile mystery protein A [Granulicella sp. dw_53]
MTINNLSFDDNMRNEFKDLRLKQLDRSLEPYQAARTAPRPSKGWIRSIRQALGVSSGELGRRLGTSRQLPLQLEKGEAEGRITLKSLRAVANALDCDLVYALVPRAGSMQDLIENRARVEAKKNVLGVEHSMALEDQAVGRIHEALEAETRRLVRKRESR